MTGSMGSKYAAVDRVQLLDELVCTLVQAAPGCSELEQQAVQNKLFGYVVRVADSGIASNAAEDSDTVFHAIRQRLVQQQRQDDAARFSELYQQLCRCAGLSRGGLCGVLSLLQQLVDSGTGLTASSLASIKPLALPKALPQPGVLLRGKAVPDTSINSIDQVSKSLRSRALQKPSSAAVPQLQPVAAVPAADAFLVKESVLVQDVLRTVQGLTGRYNTFNGAAAGSGIAVAPQEQLQIPGRWRAALHELGELGVMYKRVQAAIAEGRVQGCGSVRQALCAALADEVTDFYRLMAVLETQLAVPQPMPGDEPAAAAGPYLSLPRLQLWLDEPLRRMRLLAALVDSCAGAGGGLLAGGVWAATNVGDPLARSYAVRILHQMCVPLFDMIRRWVFEGVLEDPACEFFVVPCSSDSSSSGSTAGAAAGAGRDLWRDAYRLEPACVPPFITGELAETILRAGKSINFLRDACGDARWVQEWAPAAAGTAAALGYGQLPVLERVVVSAGRSIDERLMAVLHSSGELSRHCQAIRRYLLLGQGDFVVALLDVLGLELNKPAKDVSEVTLNHLLRQALLASAGGGGARGDEEGGAVDRLRAHKAAGGDAETGWDVFSLHYQLGPPLSSIFTPAAQTCYGQLSRLLWLMRRTERSLGSAWHTLKVEVERSLPRFAGDACAPRLAELLRRCLRLRAEMAHFNINLQYYINLEVLECAWSEFTAAAAAAPDLDCLIAAHEKFLAAVLARALLGPGQAEKLRPQLTQLLKMCMGLAPLVARFNERVQAGVLALERRAADAASNTARGDWGSTSSQHEPAVSQQDLAEMQQAVAKMHDKYGALLKGFLTGLPAAANEVNAEVRFLLARLNFSDFYTRSPKAGTEVL
uniref:Uncharacterized protein n=1 Tax=Tetradesmus obliquus TaxID=3088 RepID=A0A383WQ52_TETOB|eukprot:jgi/Sobl393_1/7319/SZX70544.1